MSGVLADRRGIWAFWLGCAVVTLGVILHLPMFLMARGMGYRLAGMPMDPGMLAGMGLIVAGIVLTGYGLLPRTGHAIAGIEVSVTPPEDAPLTRAHWVPESAKFLLHIGRRDQAHAVMRRFGSVVTTGGETPPPAAVHVPLPPAGSRYLGKTLALTVTAIAWGLINFGLLLWLPAELVNRGYSVALSSSLLTQSALIALPTVLVAALMYSRWSTKWTLASMIAVTTVGLAGLLRLQLEAGAVHSPVLPVALVIIGSNGILAILLPYTAETYPLRIRGRATGWVAGCSKLGGILAQGLSVLAVVPAFGLAALAGMAPVVLAMALIAWFGEETRGRDLRELDKIAA